MKTTHQTTTSKSDQLRFAFCLMLMACFFSGCASWTNPVANGIPVVQRFFGKGLAKIIEKRLKPGSKIRLVLAMNVLAHTDNINDFLATIVCVEL